MSAEKVSSIFRPLSLSDVHVTQAKESTSDSYDLITFLAVIQKLGIDILPITWQAARPRLGAGATGIVTQALINLHTSFAFKCLSDAQKSPKNSGDAISALINEVLVLGHPSVRKHPNIAELHGICWEVSTDGQGVDSVWPVLVFEKSQNEDLLRFARLPVGRDLNFTERLEICVQIGTAICDMHFNKFIHGDIKPSNILVFKSAAGSYTARVTDFGYSTRFLSENHDFKMSGTFPWEAPEHSSDKVKPRQARSMDAFSYGMVCVWLLFEKYLSGILPLPEDVRWAERHFQNKILEGPGIEALRGLKEGNELALLAGQLVSSEESINEGMKKNVRRFLDKLLACNPAERVIDLRELKGHSTTEHQEQRAELINFDVDVQHCEFEIAQSVTSLYQSDYRVRSYVRRLIERRQRMSNDTRAHFQLAVCYCIGLGGPRDEELLAHTLHYCLNGQKELETVLDTIKQPDTSRKVPAGTAIAALNAIGHIKSHDLASQYRTSQRLQQAEEEVKRDLRDIQSSLGNENDLWLTTMQNLLDILGDQAHWAEAELLAMDLLAKCKETVGETHPTTLSCMQCLALIYSRQGRFKEAEDLQKRTVEARKSLLNEDHPSALTGMNNLAITYVDQGRWKAAEELMAKTVTTNKAVFGDEHNDTLLATSNLAVLYRHQGRLEEARGLQEELLQTKTRVLGNEHPSTLLGMENLGTTYRFQGRWKDAEDLGSCVIEIEKRLFGEEHPNTLSSISNQIAIYCMQGRFREAEALGVQVLEAREKVLGKDHPDTLISVDSLGSTYRNLRRWKEAEELGMRATETRKKVLGEEHPDTLLSMSNLASTYHRQRKWTDAERLDVHVMQVRKRTHGEEHPSTLTSINNVAESYSAQGREEKAQELRLQVIEARKRVLGERHPSTVTSMNNLAAGYLRQEEWIKAEKLLLEITEISKTVSGKEHHKTLIAMANLASTYSKQERFDEAEQISLQVLDISKRTLGKDHDDTFQSMHELALIYNKQGRVDEAEDLRLQIRNLYLART